MKDASTDERESSPQDKWISSVSLCCEAYSAERKFGSPWIPDKSVKVLTDVDPRAASLQSLSSVYYLTQCCIFGERGENKWFESIPTPQLSRQYQNLINIQGVVSVTSDPVPISEHLVNPTSCLTAAYDVVINGCVSQVISFFFCAIILWWQFTNFRNCIRTLRF